MKTLQRTLWKITEEGHSPTLISFLLAFKMFNSFQFFAKTWFRYTVSEVKDLDWFVFWKISENVHRFIWHKLVWFVVLLQQESHSQNKKKTHLLNEEWKNAMYRQVESKVNDEIRLRWLILYVIPQMQELELCSSQSSQYYALPVCDSIYFIVLFCLFTLFPKG